MKHERKIPSLFREEILDEEYDTPASISIMEKCGPLTLLVYNRCIAITNRYPEMRELRHLLLVASQCQQEYHQKRIHLLKQQISSERQQRMQRSAEATEPRNVDQ